MKKIEIVDIINKMHGHPGMESKLREFEHPEIDMDLFWDSHIIIDFPLLERLKRIADKIKAAPGTGEEQRRDNSGS